jgi:DNA (cytosine-5)-methyltransferase 1
MKTNAKSIGFFSFFTGAGFLDLGFENAGFKSLMANEIDEDFSRVFVYARKALRKPMPKYGLQTGDICAYLDDKQKDHELCEKIRNAKEEKTFIGFIGGPPCPDFSVAGKQAGASGKNGRLSQVYVDLICRHQPDFFVFENVKGLWKTAKHRAFFDALVQQLQSHGYAVDFRLINSLEYGAPQDRERIILVGVRTNLCKRHVDKITGRIKDLPWDQFIKYTLEDVKKLHWPTSEQFKAGSARKMPEGIIPELCVEHWFEKNDVDRHPNAQDFFRPRAGLVKMQVIPEGDDSKKCFKRLHRWRYSPTAAYGNNEVHLHPYKERRLSVAEALAIQSLPREFCLPQEISLSAKFKTIGNGVPYVAALGIAKTLKKFLMEL